MAVPKRRRAKQIGYNGVRACKANRSYKQTTYLTAMRSIDRKAGRAAPDETAGLGKRAHSSLRK